jgi:hypothetical protein
MATFEESMRNPMNPGKETRKRFLDGSVPGFPGVPHGDVPVVLPQRFRSFGPVILEFSKMPRRESLIPDTLRSKVDACNLNGELPIMLRHERSRDRSLEVRRAHP